jgi:Zn-dependent protease
MLWWDRKNESLTFRLGGDVPVRVHWTFAVPIVLPFLFEWPERPLGALVHTAIVGVLLFSAVFLHELAHMWAARSRGVDADRIELYLFGGWIFFKPTSRQPNSWIWIIFAGPFVNLVLGVLFLAGYLAFWAFSDPLPYDGGFFTPPPLRSSFLQWTLWLGALVNLALGVLNLLPAFPLDGGIIARELLQPHLGPQRATKIVGACGLMLSALRFPVMLAAAAAGFFVWLPPPFRPNWRALRESGKPKRQREPAIASAEAEEIEWRGKGGWRIRK